MRILALLSFDIFRLTIGEALKSMGNDVLYLEQFDEVMLENTIASFQPDIAFSMGWDIWHVSFHANKRLKSVKEILHKHHIYHVYFAEEDWLHHDTWSKVYVAEIEPNHVLTRSTTCMPMYQKMGVPSLFFDVGCNPTFHKPLPLDPSFECDVAVIANAHFGFGEIRHKSITDLVITLFNQPFRTKIWGSHWDQVHQYHDGIKPPSGMLQGVLPFTETPKVYSSAKICISIQTCKDQISNRTFDILSCGGFLLTSDTPEVRRKLSPGVHCVTTNSSKETIQQINYFLSHPDERSQIANAGHQYAVQHFAYQKTIPTVWPQILADYQRFKADPVNRQPRITLNIDKMHFDDWTAHHAMNTAPGYLLLQGEVNSYIQKKIAVKENEKYSFTLHLAQGKDGISPRLTINILYYGNEYTFLSYGLSAQLTVTSEVCQIVKYSPAQVPANASFAIIVINKLPDVNSASIELQKLEFIAS